MAADGRRRCRDGAAAAPILRARPLGLRPSSGSYLWRLVRLDLGFSAIYGKPVATVIAERLPATILLMTASLSLAFFFGLIFGVDRRPRRQPLAGHADLARSAWSSMPCRPSGSA